MSIIGLFLDMETLNHFSALSRYFNDILNNPKSEFGRLFWKNWAVKNGGIKCYKGKQIDFKFKLMKSTLDKIKKNAKASFPSSCYLPYWCNVNCQICGKKCMPDQFNEWYFNDHYNYFCNCEMVDCESKLQIIERKYENDKRAILNKKAELRLQLLRLDERLEILDEKEKKIKTIRHVEKMKPAFENIKKNGKYKSIRAQAEKALKECKRYESWSVCVRRNANYKAPIGAGVGGELDG